MRVDRSRLPAIGPPLAFAFPEIRRVRLDNGVHVCTIEHHEVPLVTGFALLPVGSSQDPGSQPGLAALTGDLLDEGSGDLDALGIHEALGRIGAHLDTEIGADATVLEITVLDRHAPQALALLASMIQAPRLESRDFERVRDLRQNRLKQLRSLPPAVAERVFAEVLYRGHPYGHLPIGTEASLAALTLDDVSRFHGRAFSPDSLTVIAVGHASHDGLANLVAEAFGSWRANGRGGGEVLPDVTRLPPPVRDGNEVVTVHRAGAAQSELRIGHVGLPRSTPDYHALLVLNMILGGQFVSRMNMNLREQKGYTYGARTSFEFRRGHGPFVFQTSVQSEVTADAVREVLAELEGIRGARPITPEELALGQAALTRGYARNFETVEQLGRAAAQLALYGLPDDYFTTFVPKVLSISEEDVTRAARAHIQPDRLLTVIVGDRDRLGDSLDTLDLGTRSEVAFA
jgi:zinc protease